MSDENRPSVFTLVRDEPDRVLACLAETLDAVVGETCGLVRCEGDDAPAAFPGGRLWVFPWSSGEGGSGFVTLDAAAVTRAAGALAMLPAEELAAAAGAGEVPEKAVASAPGIGKLLVGALAKACGAAEGALAAGDAAEDPSGSWASVVGNAGEGALLIAARLSIGDAENAGHVLVAAPPIGDQAGSGRGTQASLPDDLSGVTLRLLGRPGDPALVGLGETVEALGGRVQQAHTTSLLADPPAAAFVISRSPSDLRARMESVLAETERPPLIVASSDRPTRDLVLSARQAGADDFLVLPTTRERLIAVLARALQPA